MSRKDDISLARDPPHFIPAGGAVGFARPGEAICPGKQGVFF